MTKNQASKSMVAVGGSDVGATVAAALEAAHSGTCTDPGVVLVRSSSSALCPGDRLALLASRANMEREARLNGGRVVTDACPACGENAYGLIFFDPGEAKSWDAPEVPAHWYIGGYARGCNCDVPREDTEAGLLSAAA